MTPCMRTASGAQGLTTLPALMHDVQTCNRRGEPLTIARTFCTLGFQRRLVRRCEWLMRMPKFGFLPHTSQTDAMTLQPSCLGSGHPDLRNKVFDTGAASR